MADRNKPINVNINLLWTLLLVGLTIVHLKPTSMVIQGFDQNKQHALGKVSIKTHFSEIEDFVNFLITDVDATYNVLFRVPRMR